MMNLASYIVVSLEDRCYVVWTLLLVVFLVLIFINRREHELPGVCVCSTSKASCDVSVNTLYVGESEKSVCSSNWLVEFAYYNVLELNKNYSSNGMVFCNEMPKPIMFFSSLYIYNIIGSSHETASYILLILLSR